ncbi:MAG: antibiotic biosynthesis monooxygenase [Gammaproteobacteria bacterium]|nr:antibiotic biosynthesis monooxygenase [Gammaproteobacteria bacterium]
MYVVTNRVPVAEGFEEMFEERFRKRAGQVEKQNGFVRMHILKPKSDDAPYVVMTYWQDEKAFLNWVDSEDFKLAHQNPMPKEAFKGGGGIEQFEVIISTD